jgi:hypothetical protein
MDEPAARPEALLTRMTQMPEPTRWSEPVCRSGAGAGATARAPSAAKQDYDDGSLSRLRPN